MTWLSIPTKLLDVVSEWAGVVDEAMVGVVDEVMVGVAEDVEAIASTIQWHVDLSLTMNLRFLRMMRKQKPSSFGSKLPGCKMPWTRLRSV
jgi:hypothetical protein